jgi:EAL domain-containing protein (putative c-di-GMP-specific phosphodiesterase class I)
VLRVFLFFVLSVECVLAVVYRGPHVRGLVAGDWSWQNVLALTGLVWLPLVFVAAWKVAAQMARDHLGVADRELAAAAHERAIGIRHRTDAVLAAESLEIALQPIIGLRSGTWIAAEALSRFPDNRPPDVWFNEAHEVGLGVELELLAVRRALEVVHALPAAIPLSFNASPGLILDPRFAELLHDPHVPLDRLMVEITEHAVVDRYEDLMNTLKPMRAEGLRISVDDTGAGYSSLRHVLKIRPDNIKLDRSFVSEAPGDAATRAMITAIVLAAMEMRASVTAEGVEDATSLAAVDRLGVDSAQGYLFARPTTDTWEWAAWATKNWGRLLALSDRPSGDGATRAGR